MRIFALPLAIFIVPFLVSSVSFRNEVDTDSEGIVLRSTGLQYGKGRLHEPLGLSVDSRGFIFVADAIKGRIFRYSDEGGELEFERPPLRASFYPMDVTVYGSYVYVLEYSENKILRYDRSGSYLDVLISFSEYGDLRPVSIRASDDGRLISTDIENNDVTLWTPLLDIELTFGKYGWSEGDFNRPMDGVILSDERIAVVETGNRRVQIFSPNGIFEELLSLPEGADFELPRAIAVDDIGNIFIGDSEDSIIYIYSADCKFQGSVDSFEGQPIYPVSMAVGWNSLLYVSDLFSHSIVVFRIVYP